MITIENLNFSYGKAPVINDLCWTAEAGGIHGLVGMNGAGKTTLFKLLSGWLKPASGQIRIHGQNLHRNEVAFMETNPQFYPYIRGREYLEIFRIKNSNFKIEAWNNIFKLPLNDLVDNYSTGMQKRLNLMGILGLDRTVMLLDEPYNGLDFEAVRIVQQLLRSLSAKGRTIIISSHIAESLVSVCSTISLLKNGKTEFRINADAFSGLNELLDSHSGFKQSDLPL